MDEWIDRLATAFGVETLTASETTRLLSASREVAHRVERKITPLATFLVGMAVGKRLAEGASREVAFGDVLEAMIHRLPPAPTEDGAS